MKKSLMALALLTASYAAFAAQEMTPGPEPNKQVTFAFAKADSHYLLLATSVPNESAGNVQSSGFMTAINSSDRNRVIDPFNKRPRDAPAFAVFAPKLSGGGGSGGITLLQANSRELHPAGYLKM